MHDQPLSCHGTGSSMKSGGVKTSFMSPDFPLTVE